MMRIKLLRRRSDTPNGCLRDIIHRSFRLSVSRHHDKAPAPGGIVDGCKDNRMNHSTKMRKDGRQLCPALSLRSSPDDEV